MSFAAAAAAAADDDQRSAPAKRVLQYIILAAACSLRRCAHESGTSNVASKVLLQTTCATARASRESVASENSAAPLRCVARPSPVAPALAPRKPLRRILHALCRSDWRADLHGETAQSAATQCAAGRPASRAEFDTGARPDGRSSCVSQGPRAALPRPRARSH